ncbi:MAG: MBL fold metallo-hydrolase [Desulfobacterales bacterium]|nr:MBL fold metallo-hydrolase [Desulfobacterales bacterium]
MNLQLIRNATMKITYAGRTILTDPMLAPKDAYNPFVGVARNPTVGLPFATEEIVSGIEAVLVTHDHPDHMDAEARRILPKEMPLFCQPSDEAAMTTAGFENVIPVETSRTWEGIEIVRTGGFHGAGKILEHMGAVSGFVLRAEGEPTVYWIGDSIWCDPVKKAIDDFQPDVIISHSGGAAFPGHGFIVMDDIQTLRVAKAAPESVVVAVHMEALDHCGVSRKSLRERSDRESIPSSRLLIPEDGETLLF